MTAHETIPKRTLRLLSRYWPYVAVGVAFAASRILYWLVFDVRFDVSPTRYFIQYIGQWFVEHDFLRSLLHLSQQPPLQNLLTGMCLRIFGAPLAFRVLHAAYIALGLTTALSMLHAMLRLGVLRAIAVGSAALYAVSPVTVIYENWLFYHVPVVALHLLTLVALLRYYRRGTLGSGLSCFGLFATSALFYALFGPVLLVVIALALLIRPPRTADRRSSPHARLLAALAIPLCVLLADKARTRFFVGHSQGDAFLWVNLTVKTIQSMRPGEVELLVRSGRITRAGLVGLFTVPLSEFDRDLRVPYAPTGVPLLDLETAPDGSVNAHALENLLIAETAFKKDALYLLSHAPSAYLASVFGALTTWYFASPLDYEESEPNQNKANLKALTEKIDAFFLPDANGDQRLLMVAFPLLVLYGIYRVLGARGTLESERSTVAAISYMLLLILYVTFATTAVSCGDFSRYRYNIDPFYVILFSLLATDCAQRGGNALCRRLARWPSRMRRASRSASLRRPLPIIPDCRFDDRRGTNPRARALVPILAIPRRPFYVILFSLFLTDCGERGAGGWRRRIGA